MPTKVTPLVQVDEAERQDKAVILINPVLKDIPSAAGVMGVRYELLSPVWILKSVEGE